MIICNPLNELKLAVYDLDDPETDFGIIRKSLRINDFQSD